MSAYNVLRKPNPKPSLSENPAVQQVLEKVSPGAVDLLEKSTKKTKDLPTPQPFFFPKETNLENILLGKSKKVPINRLDWEVAEIFGMGVPISPIVAVDYSVGTFKFGNNSKQTGNSFGVMGGAKIFNILQLYYRFNRDFIGLRKDNPTEISSHSGGFGINAPFLGSLINVRANFDLGSATVRSSYFPFRLREVVDKGSGHRPPEQFDKLFTFSLRALVCGPFDFICAGYRHTFSSIGKKSLVAEDHLNEFNRGSRIAHGHQFNLSLNLGALVDMAWLGWFY